VGILLNSIAGLIRYRSKQQWDPSCATRVSLRHPSFASRVSLREHEVLFAHCARSRGLKTDVGISIPNKKQDNRTTLLNPSCHVCEANGLYFFKKT
jgi:hypothetical protein